MEEGAFKPAGYLPCEYQNLNGWIYAPVTAGIWKQHELWDGTYTFKDLLDAHEMMMVKAENQRREEEYQASLRERD
ncbi:DUF6889 family protein [Pectinatus haikarae]|uniref:DUF6889 family protein n=1 Tax=Pectinatus haikarae TaxID=349096 RepID=UPI00351FFA3F